MNSSEQRRSASPELHPDVHEGLTRRGALVRGGGLALSIGGLSSVTALLSACGSSSGGAKGIGNGIEVARFDDLKPFVFSSATGPKPSFPRRVAFVLGLPGESGALFARGMAKGASDRGLDFVQAAAQGQAATDIGEVRTFLRRGVGGICIEGTGSNAEQPVQTEATRSGVCVFGIVSAPATVQIDADQYSLGKTQADAAVAWIRQNLGGKAKVAYINLDSLGAVMVPRHTAVNDSLKQLGSGLTLIDIGARASDLSAQAGYELIRSLLEAHPDVNVIMSSDQIIAGASQAVKAVGNTSVRYLSSAEGSNDIQDEILQGGLVKATCGVAWTMLGYATSQFTADWLEGKSIPQVILLGTPLLASPAAIHEFRKRNDDPGSYWRTSYETFLGSISYGTRGNYLRTALASSKA